MVFWIQVFWQQCRRRAAINCFDRPIRVIVRQEHCLISISSDFSITKNSDGDGGSSNVCQIFYLLLTGADWQWFRFTPNADMNSGWQSDLLLHQQLCLSPTKIGSWVPNRSINLNLDFHYLQPRWREGEVRYINSVASCLRLVPWQVLSKH